jgi:hypothetical protein
MPDSERRRHLRLVRPTENPSDFRPIQPENRSSTTGTARSGLSVIILFGAGIVQAAPPTSIIKDVVSGAMLVTGGILALSSGIDADYPGATKTVIHTIFRRNKNKN